MSVRALTSSAMAKAKTYVLVKQFDGLPKPTDLRLVEEELPPLKNGEFLAEAVYLSVDPYMKGYASYLKVGTTFSIGSQVAKVTESKNPHYKVGQHVIGEFGWRTHTISDGQKNSLGFPAPWIVPDLEGLPISLALGALGMTGITAYFGFLEICQPKAGETVTVTTAAGAVGSLVGQIAKIKGCKVIGIAGSDEKGNWLIDELKFDHFINYKDKDFETKLEKASPDGIDCYFDNVGGPICTVILNRMNPFGRVSFCGIMAGLNNSQTADALVLKPTLIFKQLKMEGFLVTRWLDRTLEVIEQNKKWIKEGKLKYRETITEGFENMFQAFLGMLQGRNLGKAIVTAVANHAESDTVDFKGALSKFKKLSNGK